MSALDQAMPSAINLISNIQYPIFDISISDSSLPVQPAPNTEIIQNDLPYKGRLTRSSFTTTIPNSS